MGSNAGPRIPTDRLEFIWDAANLRSDERQNSTTFQEINVFDLLNDTRPKAAAFNAGVNWNAGNLGYRTSAGLGQLRVNFRRSFGNPTFSFCLWNQGSTGSSGYAIDLDLYGYLRLPSQTVTSGVGVSIIFRYGASPDNFVFKTPTSNEISGWTLWSGTKNLSPGDMKLYRNAELYESRTNQTSTTSFSTFVSFFSAQNGGEQLANSPISMAAFYNKELSENEIKQFYNATRGRYGI